MDHEKKPGAPPLLTPEEIEIAARTCAASRPVSRS